MIDVRFYADKKSGKISLEVKGHAGQAESGKDIVCSAASILAYTVAQMVKYAYIDDQLKEIPKIELNEGDAIAIISCIPKKEFKNNIYHTYRVAQTGYHLLLHNYPEYVKLTSFVGLI